MINENRIRLAEWMYDQNADECSFDPYTFDPYTDAHDDYAVLEWMRGKCGVEPDYAFAQDEDAWQEFREELCEPEAYQIGDYARAALKVLDD